MFSSSKLLPKTTDSRTCVKKIRGLSHISAVNGHPVHNWCYFRFYLLATNATRAPSPFVRSTDIPLSSFDSRPQDLRIFRRCFRIKLTRIPGSYRNVEGLGTFKRVLDCLHYSKLVGFNRRMSFIVYVFELKFEWVFIKYVQY